LAAGAWRVSWDVSNIVGEDLFIEDAWVPHGKFRGHGHVHIGKTLARGATTTLELSVEGNEPDGTTVNNAFFIVRVRAREQAWRVFARMRIEFKASRMQPHIEAVTAQSLH
jgi:hypothetical protein